MARQKFKSSSVIDIVHRSREGITQKEHDREQDWEWSWRLSMVRLEYHSQEFGCNFVCIEELLKFVFVS